MLDEYQMDPALDRNRIFQYAPPPKIDFSVLPKLAKDWCAQLEAIFYQADNIRLEKKNLEKHLGTGSAYKLKKILAEQLQLVYYRLQGDLDAELGKLSDDDRKALLNKLMEDITQCTAGFHNRVNVIVDSFQKPRNLDQLLYKLRKRIVEDVASELTGEVHAWNQVSIVAATEGLGIKPNFPNDPHSGDLSTDTIKQALRETFQKKFTPFNLPCLLSHALMELIPELEVEKGKEEGLCAETIQKIIKLIKCYVPNNVTSDPLDWKKYFNIYTDKKDELKVYIVNVNWNAMYRYFFQELFKENYFKQNPEIHTLIDGAYYHLSLTEPDPTDHESSYINQLFDAKNYFDLLDQLEQLQTRFPDYYRRVSCNPNLIKRSPEIIPYLQQQFPNSNGYSSEMIQGFYLLTSLSLEVDKYVILNISHLLLLENKIGYTPLMLAAHNDPNIVEGILSFLIQHQASVGVDVYRQLFLAKNQYNSNALMLAVIHQPIAATLMLLFFDKRFLSSPDKDIKSFGINLIQEIFLEKQLNNYNVLMLAASKQADVALSILEFLTKHISSFTQNTLQTLFTAKQGNSYTAFTLTASNHPEYVKNILSFIEEHIKNFTPAALRELFFSGQQGTTCTALMLAAHSQAEATLAILTFISQYIENFDPEMIRRMFLEKDRRGYTALMLAAETQAETVKVILSFIEQHPKLFDAPLITEILLAKDKYKTTALMLAAENQPDAMILLLNFIKKNIDTLDIQAIRELLFKEIHDYEASMGVFFGGKFNTRKTLLMAAERKHPQAASALLVFIDEHIQRLGTDILTQLLSEVDAGGINPFVRACTKHPTVMKGTLNFISNITEMGSDALNNIKIEIADLILRQLPRMSLEEPSEKVVVDKILFSNSPLLLTHFTESYFAKHPANLAHITNQLFKYYLEELEDRKTNPTSYNLKPSFFNWCYSIDKKTEAAAKELEKIVPPNHFNSEQLSELKKNPRYQWFLEKTSPLGNLFAAYCSIADNAVNNRVEGPLCILDSIPTPAPVDVVPIEKPSTSKVTY